MDNKYIIITPFKNEEENIEGTIKSIIAQSIKPITWILIDDGSNDNSLNIVNRYKKKFSWIQVEKNDSYINDKGARIAAMINDFSNHDKIDFLCKIDADVSFNHNFCENMINYMNSNKKLGICSGTLIYNDKIERPVFSDLTRGATKFYNYKCFKDINGLLESTGWDTIDNISAQYKGWETKVLPIYFKHNKAEGISLGWYQRYYQSGKYFGSIPYPFYYLLMRCVYRIFNYPPIISQLVVINGFLFSKYGKKKYLLSNDLRLFFNRRIKERLKEKIKNVWHIGHNQ